MIFDSLPNFGSYIPMHPLFKTAAKSLQEEDLTSCSPGKRDLGSGMTMIISEYSTEDIQSKFIETHRRFIDIHLMAQGSEMLGYRHINDCTVIEKYSLEKDFEKLSGTCDFLTLRQGFFAVFFPQDAHMPGLCIGNLKKNVKKIVFKIPVLNSPSC